MGDRCSAEFFKSVRQKNTQAVIAELKDNQSRLFTTRKDLEKIVFDFYQSLYQHIDISEEALEEVLRDLPTILTPNMNEALSKEITEEELGGAVREMTKGKAPGFDGVPVEFFQQTWPFVGMDYHAMILKGIDDGALNEGITKGLIALIPKEGNKADLNYWRPITLLTAVYKIYAKTLQLRLQPILRDVISPEQTAFLPLRFILDNIVLTQKSLHWAKTSRQPTVFLKLDFSKAYDKVSWRFFFSTMSKMGMSEDFTRMVKILFYNATAMVNLNGSPTNSFKVEKGLRQGCPLPPYLFLIVGEALTQLITKVVSEGRLKGIILPRGKKQQSISQYADDFSFMIRGEKQYVDELVRLLKLFSEASGMEINWEKSSAYWFDKFTHKPIWLNGYGWKWAEDGDLSKLLGTPFGLNLDTKDVDHFLYSKISKKLDY